MSVAKVMISLPDKLLKQIDSRAESEHETRSGFLRRLAERELLGEEEARRKHLQRLLDRATTPMGGDAAREIREDRESH